MVALLTPDHRRPEHLDRRSRTRRFATSTTSRSIRIASPSSDEEHVPLTSSSAPHLLARSRSLSASARRRRSSGSLASRSRRCVRARRALEPPVHGAHRVELRHLLVAVSRQLRVALEHRVVDDVDERVGLLPRACSLWRMMALRSCSVFTRHLPGTVGRADPRATRSSRRPAVAGGGPADARCARARPELFHEHRDACRLALLRRRSVPTRDRTGARRGRSPPTMSRSSETVRRPAVERAGQRGSGTTDSAQRERSASSRNVTGPSAGSYDTNLTAAGVSSRSGCARRRAAGPPPSRRARRSGAPYVREVRRPTGPDSRAPLRCAHTTHQSPRPPIVPIERSRSTTSACASASPLREHLNVGAEPLPSHRRPRDRRRACVVEEVRERVHEDAPASATQRLPEPARRGAPRRSSAGPSRLAEHRQSPAMLRGHAPVHEALGGSWCIRRRRGYIR